MASWQSQVDREATLAAARHAAMRPPMRPRLSPWLVPVDLGDERLQLRCAQSSHTLAHPVLAQTFRRIEPLLNGQHTIEEITALAAPEAEPTTVVFLLNLLHGKGLLQPGPGEGTLDGEQRARWERQLRFLSHFGPDAEAMQSALAKSAVGLAGSAALCQGVRDNLERAGVGRLTDLAAPSDWQSGDGELNAGLNLIVACADSAAFEFFDAVNRVCLASGNRWLRVCCVGVVAHLGPTIVPNHSACYKCFDLRQQSHQPEFEGYRGYRSHLGVTGVPDEGSVAPLASALASQAAIEVLRLLTGFAPPVTVGRFYEFGASDPGSVGHDVLRVPRCSVCSRRRTFTQAWDRDFEPESAAL
jgi:bacteriocin biosynthesis cyclodehydratase domain-containing protein